MRLALAMILMMSGWAVAPANALTIEECAQGAAGISETTAIYQAILKQLEGTDWTPLLAETEGATLVAIQKLIELKPGAAEALGSYVDQMEELSEALQNCAE